MFQQIFTSFVVVDILVALTVSGYPSYQRNIPNGANVKVNGASVGGVGHVATAGSGALNPFGTAFKAASYAWTTALCEADSDSDGQTNGYELGDPDCVWSSGGTPSRTSDISHPGLAASLAPTAAPGVTPTPPTPSPPTPEPIVAAITPQPATSFSSPDVEVFAGFISVRWSIFTATGSSRRQGGDLMDLTMVFTNTTQEAWGAIGWATSGMKGPLVICYVDGNGNGQVDDWTGKSQSIEERTGSTTVVSTSLTSTTRVITVRISLSEIGVGSSSLRTIFTHGRQVGTTHTPHDLSQTKKKKVNFYTGEVTELESTKVNTVIALVVGVVVTLILTLIGGILNKLGFVPTATMITVIWVLTYILYAGLVILVIVMSHGDYKTSGKTSPVGRAFGDATAFCMFLVLWPTTKHIGPAQVMGIPFERFLVPHMVLGLFITIFMTTHFGLMYSAAVSDGGATFARTYIFSWSTVSRPIIPGFIAWVCLMLMVLPAIFLRRMFYSFFKTIHFLFLMVIVMGAIHHPVLWILTMPGFLVWFIDCIIRLSTWGAAGPVVDSAHYHEVAGGVTEVNLMVKAFDLQAGQYCFLTFDALGGIPHPFSVSNYDPETKRVKFLIKNMGKGTFTEKLAHTVKAGTDLGSVMWMGPYGNLQVPLSKPQHVVLCCGGIGVTPMLTTMQYIGYKLAEGSAELNGLKSVTFIWTLPKEDLAAVVLPLLDRAVQMILASSAEVKLEVCIHVTREEPKMVATGITFEAKRPVWEKYITKEGDDITGVYACGPAPMMSQVVAAAGSVGAYIHTETFEF